MEYNHQVPIVLNLCYVCTLSYNFLPHFLLLQQCLEVKLVDCGHLSTLEMSSVTMVYAAFFAQTRDSQGPPTTIFTRSRFFQLFPPSKTQNPCERNKISKLRGNPREFDEGDARYPKEGVLGILPQMETTLDKMFGFRW